ncbi:MAG: hypothetical protein J6R47_04320 [Acholeplasmatales bacterium]|nr:hypothetical protein [Acholeplasmatales bacterium]
MFFKKKKTIKQDTPLDKKIKALNEERLATAYTIRQRAKKVIVCNGVIDLYPEGADKEKAKRDADKWKEILICAVGHYDSLLRQYEEALSQEGERNTTTFWTKDTKTSHEWIEMAYEEFYKK